ncbi:Prolipoprotein diacylglyceryltransferase [Candidatus Karelsulcia muelleri DMIN]|uniref:Phosphatidylglycerol--prolipoprotein diacylglyceryl transferase n=1 Tax=Karelsulcia muelleri (strain DMIN) TaxID=641892 RepID=D5D8G6_KARMD|nr:Prolipoprotein diacylglyceryltransferase [Candidatus Karelsulcia muelleri DMIN]
MKKHIIYWDPIKLLYCLGIKIYIYSIMFIISFIFFLKKIYYSIDRKKIDNLILYSIIGLLIGARTFHVIFYNFFFYKKNIIEAIFPIHKESNSYLFFFIKNYKFIGYQGLSSHGAALGLLISTYLYNRKILKTNFLFLCDKLCIFLALSGFFIRIGNFFNSEMLGTTSNLPFSILFVQIHYDKINSIKRHPSQLYESISYIIIFKIISFLYNKKNIKGYIFSIFLIFMWSIRFIIEFFKEPKKILNTGQLLSIPFIITGFYLQLFQVFLL